MLLLWYFLRIKISERLIVYSNTIIGKIIGKKKQHRSLWICQIVKDGSFTKNCLNFTYHCWWTVSEIIIILKFLVDKLLLQSVLTPSNKVDKLLKFNPLFLLNVLNDHFSVIINKWRWKVFLLDMVIRIIKKK